MRNSTFTLALVVSSLLVAPARTAAQNAPRSGHIAASGGVTYYYEIHGQGEPLLLLHGGLGSIDMFGPVLPALVPTVLPFLNGEQNAPVWGATPGK